MAGSVQQNDRTVNIAVSFALGVTLVLIINSMFPNNQTVYIDVEKRQ